MKHTTVKHNINNLNPFTPMSTFSLVLSRDFSKHDSTGTVVISCFEYHEVNENRYYTIRHDHLKSIQYDLQCYMDWVGDRLGWRKQKDKLRPISQLIEFSLEYKQDFDLSFDTYYNHISQYYNPKNTTLYTISLFLADKKDVSLYINSPCGEVMFREIVARYSLALDYKYGTSYRDENELFDNLNNFWLKILDRYTENS